MDFSLRKFVVEEIITLAEEMLFLINNIENENNNKSNKVFHRIDEIIDQIMELLTQI